MDFPARLWVLSYGLFYFNLFSSVLRILNPALQYVNLAVTARLHCLPQLTNADVTAAVLVVVLKDLAAVCRSLCRTIKHSKDRWEGETASCRKD